MKKSLCFIISMLLLSFNFAFAQNTTNGYDNVSSAILIDKNTGYIMFEKNPDEKNNISGINKLMGIAVVYDAINDKKISMEEEILVGESARGIGGSVAFLEIGSSYKCYELMKAVLTVNANDAMIALAEKVSGNLETFIEEMNKKATNLGMNNSVFTNVTGFYDQQQYSTARDLAKLAQYVLNNNSYTTMSSEYMYDLIHPTGRSTQIVNTNKLVRDYDKCDGMMTGSNKSENYSIVATGKKGDYRLISVVLDAKTSDERNEAAKSLLEYGFSNFVSKKVLKDQDLVAKNIEINNGDKKINALVKSDVYVVTPKGSEKNIEKIVNINEELNAPISKGDIVGEVEIKLDNEVLARVDLISDEDVREYKLFVAIKDVLNDWTK